MPTLPAAIERRFRMALLHLNSSNLEAATAECTALQRLAPEDPAVLQLHATIALRAGRPADALSAIRRSLTARRGHVPSLVLMAQAARALGAIDQAVEALKEAVMRAPHLPDPLFQLCRTLLDAGDPLLDEMLKRAAEKFAAHAREWYELGLALQRAQQSNRAMVAFGHAVRADPTSPQALFAYGLLLRENGYMEDARTALWSAVALDPTSSAAWFALGLTCQDLLDEAGAATAFQSALRERPEFAEAAVNLGIALQRLGNTDAAITAYRNAMRIRPDTFGRIAQAITAARSGMLWLDLAAFRRSLED